MSGVLESKEVAVTLHLRVHKDLPERHIERLRMALLTVAADMDYVLEAGVDTPTPLTEEDAIDADVYAALPPSPAPAIDLTTTLGWTWPEDAGKLRLSLLRLQKAGKAQLVYGFGWGRKA
jgi:hypothetical protein